MGADRRCGPKSNMNMNSIVYLEKQMWGWYPFLGITLVLRLGAACLQGVQFYKVLKLWLYRSDTLDNQMDFNLESNRINLFKICVWLSIFQISLWSLNGFLWNGLQFFAHLVEVFSDLGIVVTRLVLSFPPYSMFLQI
jgi:hypothetical protein